jgi:hypothetical protein
MDINDIKKQADLQRQKEANQFKRNRKQKNPKPFIPSSATSWKVFSSIYPHQPNLLVWLGLPLILAVVGWVLIGTDTTKYGRLWPYALAVTSIPFARYLILQIQKWADYPRYKEWQSKLGFQVYGWDYLGSIKNFPRTQYWNDLLIITIQVRPTASQQTIDLINDALYLFTRSANEAFYEADQVQAGRAGDTRKRWTIAEKLIASGSADGLVMGELYVFVSKQLHAIHQQTNAIESLRLNFSKSVYEIKPPSAD